MGSVTALDFSASKTLLSMIDINKERLDNLVEALRKKGHPQEKVQDFVVSFDWKFLRCIVLSSNHFTRFVHGNNTVCALIIQAILFCQG